MIHGRSPPGALQISPPLVLEHEELQELAGGAGRRAGGPGGRSVIVGIPKEVKNHEYRVAATPEGARELVHAGHRVVIEAGAGVGSAIADEQYVAVGARDPAGRRRRVRPAELIVKVKEPQPEEYERFRSDHVLFTFLHLAADEELTKASSSTAGSARSRTRRCRRPTAGCRCSRRCPRSPAGWRPRSGAKLLERPQGGRGVLMGGASGVRPAQVVVLGGGMAGGNAAQIAAGMEAEVVVVDRNIERLREIDRIWHGRIQTVASRSSPSSGWCSTPTS